jgi:Fic family protein
MQALLSKADRALGRLDGSVQTLPDPDLFVFMYVRKEAVLSSQIEGTQSSINDVLEVEASIFDPDPEHRKDAREVLNYVAAMDEGLQLLQNLPLSIRLIRKIHSRLMQGVRGKEKQPGEIRTIQNWIGPSNTPLNQAIFVPPPPNEVMNALGDLEHFLHEDPPNIPTLLKVGLAHAQFETIHPFLDGNGRIGRLLITFLLCEREILSRPVLYLSHYFRRNQQAYYDLLQRVRDEGDWESWMKFFLSGVATVANEATETSRQIVALREKHRAHIVAEFGRAARNGLIVLEHLFRQPIVRVKEIQALLRITYAGANGLIRSFQDHGILAESTGHKRNRRFVYSSYVEIFSRD